MSCLQGNEMLRCFDTGIKPRALRVLRNTLTTSWSWTWSTAECSSAHHTTVGSSAAGLFRLSSAVAKLEIKQHTRMDVYLSISPL